MVKPWYRINLVEPKDARVGIFCMVNETYAPLSQLTLPNFKAYCELHGYYLRCYGDGFYLSDEVPNDSYGDKVKWHYYYDMRGHFDIVMYLDIDSLFVDMNVKIDVTFACGRPYHDQGLKPGRFLWTYGPDGGPQSGLLIAHTDEVTEKHLRYAYRYAADNNNVRHGKIEPHGISDQDAMTALMSIPPWSETFGNCVPMESIGLYYTDTEEKNPWIVTCKGGPLTYKLQQVGLWIAKRRSVLASSP